MAGGYYSPLDLQGAAMYAKALVPDYAAQQLAQREMAAREAQVGAMRQQEQRLLAKQQAEAQAAADYQRQVEEVWAARGDPGAVSHFMMRNPDAAEAMKKTVELEDETTRKGNFTRVSGLYNWARTDPKAAGRRLEEQAMSENPPDENDLRVARRLQSDNPQESAQAIADLAMLAYAYTGDPEKFREAHKQFNLPDYSAIGETGLFQDANTGQVYRAPVIQGPGGINIAPEFGNYPMLSPNGLRGGAMAPNMPGATMGGFAGGTFDTATGQQVDPGAVFTRMLGLETRNRQFDAQGRTIRSPKGAIGIAQIMPATGPEAARLAGEKWDLKRLATDADYNQRLGQAYYTKQLQDFGDPYKAAAAYNAGPGRVRSALKKGGPTGWLNHLPAETRKYVSNLVGEPRQAEQQVVDGTTYIKVGENWHPVTG